MKKAEKLISLCILVFLASCAPTALQKEQSEAFLHKGISFIELQQYPNALKELMEAEKYNSQDERIYYHMGIVYHAMNMKEKAFESFLRAISIKNDYSEAHNFVGTLYNMDRKWDEAIDHFNKAVANPLYTTPALPLYNAGWAYYSKKDYNKALDSYTRALQREPETVLRPQIQKFMGIIYFDQADYASAIKHLKQAVTLDPNLFDAYFFLGESYLKIMDKTSAKKAFQSVIDLAPKSSFGKKASYYLNSLK
ncbi:MAG TPA: tetratricopeptide repeat protein [Smithellaceae bacterium]|nr:tetratricopeptide repeat protein [Smithellaceae bacterium]